MRNGKVMATEGAGFIGSSLARLLAAGKSIIIINNPCAGWKGKTET